MFSKHTLSYQGEKFTLATVRSINNTTYPYTVQTIISMIGTLVGPLFLCLKEPSGRKLTTSLVKYWRDEVFEPIIQNKNYLLISDCWGEQGDDEIYEQLTNSKRLEIPKKTTSMIQPLDVYFNRQYKVIARKIYDHIR
ncbi:unnamed protein product [Rotaria sp. Silwood1]|nr:unnamed protein product [Rotaria sp. Silwood1]